MKCGEKASRRPRPDSPPCPRGSFWVPFVPLHPKPKALKMRQLKAMRLADSSSALLAPAPLPAAAGLHLRVGKLCIALQAQTPAELLDRAEAVLADCRFLEFRLDSLPKPAAALP